MAQQSIKNNQGTQKNLDKDTKQAGAKTAQTSQGRGGAGDQKRDINQQSKNE